MIEKLMKKHGLEVCKSSLAKIKISINLYKGETNPRFRRKVTELKLIQIHIKSKV